MTINVKKREGESGRRIKDKDGNVFDVFVEEKPMQNLIVKSVLTAYENDDKRTLHATPLYMYGDGHLPDNPKMKYNIIDRHDIRFVRGVGENHLCLKKLRPADIKRLPNHSEWHNPSMTVHEVVPSIDICRFFRQNDWTNMLELWVTENLHKDRRLIDAFKSVVIPLIPMNWYNDNEVSQLQGLNNHQFWITNTKAGKSEFPRLLGVVPSNEWTMAGLFGGSTDDGKIRQIGALEGYGIHFFDEAMYVRNVRDEALIPSLLTYIQQGSAMRELKVKIPCRGTKSVIFASNPASVDDMVGSVAQFLHVLSGVEYPEKIGSRIGSFLVGADFRNVVPDNPISTYRGFVSRLIQQTMQKFYFARFYKIMKTSMHWAYQTKELENTYKSYSTSCPNKLMAEFISGLRFGIPKLRMCAVRIYMLEHMNELVIGFNQKQFFNNMKNELDNVLPRLVSPCLSSLDKLTYASDRLLPNSESAELLHKKFPDMSVRDIGSIIGVSKSTVDRWLGQRDTLNRGSEEGGSI